MERRLAAILAADVAGYSSLMNTDEDATYLAWRSARSEVIDPGIEIQDLHYGEILFHFYQDDEFTALTHLLAARESGHPGTVRTPASKPTGVLHDRDELAVARSD